MFSNMNILKVIKANDPAITDITCYCFSAKETRQVYEAIRHNPYITQCEVRICESAQDYNLMAHHVLEILTIARNNLLRVKNALMLENEALKVTQPLRETNGGNT
jgi:hypothetical protein